MKRRLARLHVTDHAVLRYLEREYGLDLERLREHVAGKVINGAELGAIGVKIGRVKFVLDSRPDPETDQIAVRAVTALERNRRHHGR